MTLKSTCRFTWIHPHLQIFSCGHRLQAGNACGHHPTTLERVDRPVPPLCIWWKKIFSLLIHILNMPVISLHGPDSRPMAQANLTVDSYARLMLFPRSHSWRTWTILSRVEDDWRSLSCMWVLTDHCGNLKIPGGSVRHRTNIIHGTLNAETYANHHSCSLCMNLHVTSKRRAKTSVYHKYIVGTEQVKSHWLT